jgi:hypothetical protein
MNAETRLGMIYIIKAGPYYKIGKSSIGWQRPKTVIDRMNGVEPKLPFQADLLAQYQCFFQDMDRIERLLHDRFSDKRHKGEWFELSDADLLWTLEQDEMPFWWVGWNIDILPTIGLKELPERIYGLA